MTWSAKIFCLIKIITNKLMKRIGGKSLKSKVKVSITLLCLTLCNPVDYGPPGSSVHGIFQARILEWVAISFSRGSSQTQDRTRVECSVAGKSLGGSTMRQQMACIQEQNMEEGREGPVQAEPYIQELRGLDFFFLLHNRTT